MNHETYISEVLDMAEAMLENNSPDVPIAALIVKQGQVIARATNSREEEQSILGHAEINALEAASKVTGDWNLSGCTIYVSLEPCTMCAGAILQAHIKDVVFSAFDIKSGALGSRYNISTNSMNIQGGILEERGQKILQRFFQDKR